MPNPVAALRLKFDKSQLWVPKEVKRIEEKVSPKAPPKPRPMTLGKDQTVTGGNTD
jgi:hypothetical protein